MIDEIYFLALGDVISIHTDQIMGYGGLLGIRDLHLLNSAIFAPQAMFANKYLHEDIFQMAAALAIGIIKNHPFVDGNKRTGLVATFVFLQKNGVALKISPEAAFELTISIATSKLQLPEISATLRKSAH